MKSFPQYPALNPWLLLILALALLVLAIVKIMVEWPFAVHEDPKHEKGAR